MNNQLYAEAGVKRKDNAKTMALRVLLVLGVLLGIILMLIGGVIGVIGIALVIAIVFLYPRLNVEYEYIFVDGQIDFDRITGKAKRKTIFKVDMEQVEIVAPESSHALDGYTYTQLDRKDFTSGDKSVKPYVIIANVEDKKCRIAFEPSEKMISMMKQKSPRKISQY